MAGVMLHVFFSFTQNAMAAHREKKPEERNHKSAQNGAQAPQAQWGRAW